MPRIFISYRRADSRKDVGRLYDRMVQAFGKENVFMDVDNIPLGSDFRGVLAEAVSVCNVMLVVIGQQWLAIKDENGDRRLDNPGDFVRIEVETGLYRDSCVVIPVLVDNASMPKANDLPASLRELAFKNAVVVRDNPDFHSDVTRLIKGFQPHQVSRSRMIIGITAVAVILLVVAGMFSLLSRGGENKQSSKIPATENGAIQTTEPISTSLASPTHTPTAEPSATNALTLTSVLTETNVNQTSDGITHLDIHRSGNSIAACTDQVTDLSILEFDFGYNTTYRLGDWFPDSIKTQINQCWCLQLDTLGFSVPDVCQGDNTKKIKATVTVMVTLSNAWRNGTLKLVLNNVLIGTCEAQTDNLGVYKCPFTLK